MANPGLPSPIPGMAWDPINKRYFAIQVSGTAKSTHSEYSFTEIKKRETKRQAQEEELVKRRKRSQSGVRKPHRMWTTVAGAAFRREFEQQGLTSLKHSLVGCIDDANSSDWKMPNPLIPILEGELIDYAYDETTDRLFTVSCSEDAHYVFTSYSESASKRLKSASKPRQALAQFNDDGALIFLKPMNRTLRAPQIRLSPGEYVSLVCPEGNLQLYTYPETVRGYTCYSVPLGPFIRTCVPNPFRPSHVDLAAVGKNAIFEVISPRLNRNDYGSRFISINDLSNGQNGLSVPVCQYTSRLSDDVSLEWITPDIFAFNERRNKIRFIDRQHPKKQNTVLEFHHPTSPLHIARASHDGNAIIVAGLENSMCLYDIRFLGRDKSSPVLSFDYSNKMDDRLGIDVSLDLGITAASQDNQTIKVYCTKTGAVLRTLRAEIQPDPRLVYKQFGKIQILEKQNSGLRILANYGGSFTEFGMDHN
jgi:hypothetical protein